MCEMILRYFGQRATQPPAMCFDEGVITMKGLLFGMLFCMAAGADAFVFIPDGPLSFQQMFFFGLICGTLGTLAGCAMFDTPTLKILARQAGANLLLAAVLAPSCAVAVSNSFGIAPTIMLIAPIACLLGVSGSPLVMKVLPSLMDMIAKKGIRRAKSVLGVDDDESDGKKS
jgi:hypothetical protein